MMTYHGRCHCGALQIEFVTARPLAPRACQCRFCRRQDARMVSDPGGEARLMLGAAARRYRFGSEATDFLFCGCCGCYVGATVELDGQLLATLNLNCFDEPRLELVAEPVDYSGETPLQRAERRRARWSPARLG